MEISGNYPTILRARTGLFSLDVATSRAGEIGLPLRSIVEIYGYPNVGKSTLSYYLSGAVAGKREIAICDLEMLDRSYLQSAIGVSGYDGKVTIVDSTDDKGKPVPHEEMLMSMAEMLYSESCAVSVLDSVGMVMPIAESKGDFGEAFMGKRAKLVAQVSRALINNLRNKELPSVAFVINHVHPNIGAHGHSTAGGETLKYAAQVKLMLWTKEVFAEEDGAPIGFYVAGQVEKLRYGGRGRKFGFFIVPSIGVHLGASAMFDCLELGLAERDKSGRVRVDGKPLGYIKADLLRAAATGNYRRFESFREKLVAYEERLVKGELEDDRVPDVQDE